ncbi:MAG: long-chain fatty acid--CoA ligase [Chromatiales bacterium]|nr:long-chain fatty acid--CoA ligase [Chromatiales bacterium]
MQPQNLYALFLERLSLSENRCAYLQWHTKHDAWREYTWRDIAVRVGRLQHSFKSEGLVPGDRVAIMLANGVDWIVFDQAALGCGLITIPLYNHDNAGNVAHILKDSAAKLLFSDKVRIENLILDDLPELQRIVSVDKSVDTDRRCVCLSDWQSDNNTLLPDQIDDGALASIIYTSGTTGPPKGVMLSHTNILQNAVAAASVADIGEDDLLLSFLPLSHSFERTAGYYMTMLVGAKVAFSRSLQQIRADLQDIKPTVLISVPRLYETIYDRLQASLMQRPAWVQKLFQLAVSIGWYRRSSAFAKLITAPLWPVFEVLFASKLKQAFGGRMRFTISGGAPLPVALSRLFAALGVTIYQGYGLTESSPVVSVNFPDLVVGSVGQPIPGVEVKIAQNDELLVRGSNVMQGYWRLAEKTAEVIDADGWLHTGDQARLDKAGNLYITGRIKEIIVLSNGEKIAPADIEQVLVHDPLFQQAMVYGEGHAFLIALLVLDKEALDSYLQKHPTLNPDTKLSSTQLRVALSKHVHQLMDDFPAYAKIRRVVCLLEPWTVENGLLTPTLKLKRARVVELYQEQINQAYG